MKYIIVFILMLFVSATITQNVRAQTQSAIPPENQALIAVLQLKLIELKNALTQLLAQQTATSLPPRLWGVDGPTTIPAGEAGSWNQDNRNRPSQYTYFKLDNLRWTWGDGSVTLRENFHAYKKAGTYKAKLEGLNDAGDVVDSVDFIVNVTKEKKYGLEITRLDTNKNYRIGGEIPITYVVTNAPSVNTAAWVGIRLISQATGKEFFLADAWSSRGESGSVKIPGAADYNENGPLPPGQYRLEVYMYGSGTSDFPSVTSAPFTITAE